MCLETKAFIGQVSATLNCKYMCKIETDWLMCLLSQKNNNGTTQQFYVGKSTKKKWKLWMTLILTCICYQFPFLLMYICTIDFFFCTCGLAFTFIVFEHLCFYAWLFIHHFPSFIFLLCNTWSKLTWIIVSNRNISQFETPLKTWFSEQNVLVSNTSFSKTVEKCSETA